VAALAGSSPASCIAVMAKRKRRSEEDDGGAKRMKEEEGGATPAEEREEGKEKEAEEEVAPEIDGEEEGIVAGGGGEQEEEGDDSDDDGFNVVLRDPSKAPVISSVLVDDDEENEGNAGDQQQPGEMKDGEGPAEGKKTIEMDEEASKFKFSHGKKRRYPKFPGRASQVNALNYVQFALELKKRNTPFEVDLGDDAEKPWIKYNLSLDDFFNYGFSEESWKDYAAYQVAKRIYELEKEEGLIDEDDEVIQLG